MPSATSFSRFSARLALPFSRACFLAAASSGESVASVVCFSSRAWRLASQSATHGGGCLGEVAGLRGKDEHQAQPVLAGEFVAGTGAFYAQRRQVYLYFVRVFAAALTLSPERVGVAAK